MIVAIHQPNFIPWFPFFQKMAAADLFVVMRHCQFEKNNYQNRFCFRGQWFTLSVNGDKHLQSIDEKSYTNPHEDWARILQRLREFNHVLGTYTPLISERLSFTNTSIIRAMARQLGIKTQIVFDRPTDLRGTARLVDLCRTLKATTYLSGPSGKHYLELEQFSDAGINVAFQDTSSIDKRHAFEIIAENATSSHS